MTDPGTRPATDPATTLDITGGILVGHDGSEASDKAVRWAVEWAGRVGCDVHVVRGWVMSSAPRPSTWSPGYVPPMTDFEQSVLEHLERDVKRLELPPDGPAVHCWVLHGPAGRRLVEVSDKAVLVVVASRGSGGFRGLVLGSTADQIVRHANCPVVVIPAGTPVDNPVDADSGLRQD